VGAGFGPGLALAHLQRATAAHTRACLFDRAGQGWSDPSLAPRTSANIAAELRRLLERAGERGPFVLAGWSFGGLNARQFAYLYPRDVAGLVLIDASHERQLEVLGGSSSPALLTVFGLLPGFVDTGLPALAPQWVPMLGGDVLPEEFLGAYQALPVMDSKMAAVAVGEMRAIEASFAEVAAARAARPGPRPLGDLPVVVLMKGHAEAVPGLALSAEEQQARWHMLQSDLAAQSSRGRLVVAEQSGHNIPYQQPELILGALLDVLVQARE
jgi:pimeloyl-ACP methyl ester carboxylesterase